jgi:hypothetical protein
MVLTALIDYGARHESDDVVILGLAGDRCERLVWCADVENSEPPVSAAACQW